MAEDHEGVPENQVTFYHTQGHNHDGENSTLIDFSKYDLSDILDLSEFNAAVLGTIENNTIRPRSAIIGIGDALVEVDGSRPEAISGLTVTSTAHATSPGNILINVAWDPPTGGNAISYIVQLHKSEAGVGGSYVLIESHDTTALSHVFQFVDNAAGDVGSIYYKVSVIALSPSGLRSLIAETTVAPATDSSIPGNITFNDDSDAFDEGVKAAFKGFFVHLDDNTEFDVKQGRGQYEYQVSTTKVAANFDDNDKLQATGRANSTFFMVNNLEVRLVSEGAKINYYLRVRAIDTSNNSGTWVYYKNEADGGSNGAGTTTANAASAINVLDINGVVDIGAHTITATEIYSKTITAEEIKGGEITATELTAELSFEAGGNMQSSDYSASPGSESGWKIFGGTNAGSGSAIFNNITARGVIKANTGEIGGTDGWVIAANAIQSNASISAANTIALSTGGSAGTAFLRIGEKETYSDTEQGIWMDPANGLVIGSGAGANFGVTIAGVITATAGTIGGWSLGAGKLYSGTNIELSITDQAVSVGGGKAVLRRFPNAGAGQYDLKIGIDASGGYDPGYDTAGDLVMWWDDSASKAKFSIGDKLTYDGTTLTVTGNIVVENAPTVRTALGVEDGAEANPTEYSFGPDENVATFDMDDVPGSPASDEDGLFIGGNKLGYWSGTAWTSYLDNSGNFYLTGSGSSGLSWAANTSTLTITDGTITAPTIQTGTSGSRLMLSPLNALPDVTVDSGTLQAGDGSAPFTEVTLKSGSSAYDDYYNDLILTTTGGTGSGQTRIISDYVGSTKKATVSVAFTVDPDGTTTYTLTRETNTFLRGYTGKATEDYPGFIYYYGERDLVTHSRHWGRVAFSAPRYSSTLAYSGFNFSHSDDGWGELTFGLPSHADQFVIADAGSGSTPTNTFNRGGITIVSDVPASTNNTLYADGTTLKWHGAPIGGGSGVDSIIAGTGIDVSGATGDVTVTHEDYATAGTYGSTGRYIRSLTVNDQGHVTAIDHEPDATLYGSHTTLSLGTVWAASTNLGITNFTSVDNNASAILVKSAVDNTAATCYWFDIADLNISKFQNDAGYTSNSGNIGTVQGTGALTGSGSSGTVSIDLATGTTALTSYLLKSGGDMSGTLNFTTTNVISRSGSTRVYLWSGGDHTLANSNGYMIKMKAASPAGIWCYDDVRPSGTLGQDLGQSGIYWNNVYLNSHVWNSDENVKKDIVDEVKGLDFINSLRPVTYKYKMAGRLDSGEERAGVRTHHGFIAQEIATVLGADADGDALWTNSTVPAQEAEDAVLDPDDSSVILEPAIEAVDAFDQQGLRYEEFISVAVKGIQELSTKLDAAEARLAALEA